MRRFEFLKEPVDLALVQHIHLILDVGFNVREAPLMKILLKGVLDAVIMSDYENMGIAAHGFSAVTGL